MNNTFLKHFMQFVYQLTNSERAIAADMSLAIRASVPAYDDSTHDERLRQIALRIMAQAAETHTVVISNDIITDLIDAPTTNTNFSNLCVSIAMPLQHLGVIYIERHIRKGIISKEEIQNIMHFAEMLISQNQLNLSDVDILELYTQSQS